MSNIPENEKNGVTENGEVFSTVFSNPEEKHKVKEEVKRKKPLTKIIAFFLSLAILIGGTFAVIELIPEREEEDDYVPIMEEIEVLKLESDTFKTVSLKNQNGEFNFFSEKVENTDTSSESEEETTAVNWYLSGYERDLISSPAAAEKVEGISIITAIRKITELSPAECGLDNPSLKAEITISEDNVISLAVGSSSPDKTGYYFKYSGDENVYLISEATKANFEFNALDLANTDVMSGFPLTENMTDYMDDSNKLSTFDSITVSGKNFEESVVIVPNPDDKLLQYKTVSPMTRRVEELGDIFTAFQNGITVSGAYSFDTTAKGLKEFGLDNPDFVMTMKAGGKTHTFKFKLQADGGYAAVCDGEKLIKKVDAANLSYIGYKATDFYSTWVCIEYLIDLSAFEIKYGDKSYEFIIESTENDEGELETTKVTIDGKTIDVSEFKNFYQECISLNCTDFSTDKVSGNADYTITFKYTDKKVKTYEFFKSGASRYQYRENGVDLGKVNSSQLNKVVKALEDLV